MTGRDPPKYTPRSRRGPPDAGVDKQAAPGKPVTTGRQAEGCRAGHPAPCLFDYRIFYVSETLIVKKGSLQ